jgi:hypothetical protein
MLAVNCSTLGALAATPLAALRRTGSGGQPPPRASYAHDHDDHNHDQEERPDRADQSVIYCGDIEARRRLLISGKHQLAGPPADQPGWSATNQRHKGASWQQHQQQKRYQHHAAYVSFEVTTSASLNSTADNNGDHRDNYQHRRRQRQPQQRQQQQQQLQLPPQAARTGADYDDKLDLSNLNGAADSSRPIALDGAKSLDQLLGASSAELDTSVASDNTAWRAPPLLEWFINNQEVSGPPGRGLSRFRMRARRLLLRCVFARPAAAARNDNDDDYQAASSSGSGRARGQSGGSQDGGSGLC